MNTPLTPQKRMDAAFDNYFALSDILRDDLVALLDSESDSQHWRRNYIRVAASLVEGYAHCLRDMCAVSFECVAPSISDKEAKVITSERNFDANDRLKLTLRVAYKLFELAPVPNFGGPEWLRAQRVLTKRHLLMHPKTPADLEVPDALWSELREDVTWLVAQLFSFISTLQGKHGG
jgi:hypothetical protein